MQLLRKAFQGLVVAFLALGFLALGPKSSFAFTNGQYNKITIQLCLSVPFEGFDFLVVSDSITGGTLVLGEPVAIIEVAPICHPGNSFFAFFNNGVVTNVAIVPGL
jgi:hypothetical protein